MKFKRPAVRKTTRTVQERLWEVRHTPSPNRTAPRLGSTARSTRRAVVYQGGESVPTASQMSVLRLNNEWITIAGKSEPVFS